MKNSSVALLSIFDAISRNLVRHCGHDPEAMALALETAFVATMERHQLVVKADGTRDDLKAYAEKENLERYVWNVRELITVFSAICSITTPGDPSGATAREALTFLHEHWDTVLAAGEGIGGSG